MPIVFGEEVGNNDAHSIDILFDGLFGKDAREGATWSAWKYRSGVGSFGNVLYLFKDNKISIKDISISTNGTQLNVSQAIEQNFKDKEPGDRLSTWQENDERIIEIPSDSINIWAYHQNNIEQE